MATRRSCASTSAPRPGVGKTFAMLNEGRRRARARHRRRRRLRRDPRPAAHRRRRSATSRSCPAGSVELPRARRSRRWTSTPCSPASPRSRSSTSSPTPTCPARGNEKRWQDVDELLDAGIDVISTVNIQHLESLNDVVERITGVTPARDDARRGRARRRPDRARRHDPRGAAPAHGARQHLRAPRRSTPRSRNYFRPGNLAALRELALLWVADQVDEALEEYRERHGITEPWETRERVVVAAHRRARRRAPHPAGGPHRAAGRTASCSASTSRSDDGLAGAGRPSARRRTASCSRSSAASYHEVVGADVAAALVELRRGRERHPARARREPPVAWAELTAGARSSTGHPRRPAAIDVHVISTSDGGPHRAAPRCLPSGPG